MELPIRELVRVARERGVLTPEYVVEGGRALTVPGIEALYTTTTALLLGASRIVHRAMEIANRHLVADKKEASAAPSIIEGWTRGERRALGSLGAPWLSLLKIDAIVSGSLWTMLVRISEDHTKHVTDVVSALHTDGKLQPVLRQLLAFAGDVPTIDKQMRDLKAADFSGIDDPLSWMKEAGSRAEELVEASINSMLSRLEESKLDEQKGTAIWLWAQALVPGGMLMVPLQLTASFLRSRITTGVELDLLQHTAEGELPELDRELLMVCEAMPAAVLIAATLYADALKLRYEVVVGGDPSLAVMRMLLKGKDVLRDVEDKLGDGPCAGIIRYWCREAVEFTPDHIGLIYILLKDLYRNSHYWEAMRERKG